jgi:hypothetical protein
MLYEVSIQGGYHRTGIRTKKSAERSALWQAAKHPGSPVFVFRKYPETDRRPSHTEIIHIYEA